MNKSRVRWFHLAILLVVAILIVTEVSLPVRAESSSPAEMVQSAWNNALQAGSYRYISDSVQTLIPRPVPEMIGEQDTTYVLAIDGAVVLPNQAYTEMMLLSNQRSDAVAVLRDGEQSFMLMNGELKPVQESVSLASQSIDMLGYLAAADQVTLLDPPEDHPDLVRYSYVINGLRFAEYVRQKAEANLRREPGAPQNLSVKSLPQLEKLSGRGELWVDQAGFPVRQVLELDMPEVNDQYSAHIKMSADFSAYGAVESLPRAVQGPDGKWQLQGTLKAGSPSSLGGFPGFGQLPAQAAASQPAEGTPVFSSLWSQLKSRLPLQVSPTAVFIFVLILLTVIIIRYYHRNPRRCYALIVFTLIPIMVFSPLLESTGVVKFIERQAQAARESAAALPDLLRALGFDTQGIEAASTGEGSPAQTHSNPDSQALINSLAEGNLTNSKTAYAPMQVNSNSQPIRCGEGDPSADFDSDGLNDQVELCLGTNPNRADTDHDGIADKLEIDGFEHPAGSGKVWTSDPLNPDTNSDGIIDTLEWPATIIKDGQTIQTGGKAAFADQDADGVPNIWDDDDDNDGVPDAQDISPFAVTDFADSVKINTQSTNTNIYELIEIQVQPLDPDHLRYSTTPLDWPNWDDKGNVKDLDYSQEDMRLVPFLIVTTNVAPDQALGDKYGFRSWLDENGKYILMAPLVPVESNGAIHGFYAKVAYAPGQTANIQWDAQMFWFANVQNDYYVDWIANTETSTVTEYQDSFCITGLKVTRDDGYEAAVIGTPYQVDDLYLFRLLLALNNTFTQSRYMPGQTANETALQAMARTYTDVDDPINKVPGNEVVVSGPVSYSHLDAGLAGIGSVLAPGLLEGELYGQYYDNDRCNDADGKTVDCGSLIVAYESAMVVRDLSDLSLASFSTSGLNVSLPDADVLVTRGVRMNVYEKSASGWQITTAARMLELMEQRYKNDYATAMRALYPDLDENAVRFITYAAYLWATSASYNPISQDGQALVPDQANIDELEAEWMLTPEEEGEAGNAVEWWAIGTGIALAVSGFINNLTLAGGKVYIAWDNLNKALTAWANKGYMGDQPRISKFDLVGAGLIAVAAVASVVMGIINAVCAANSEAAMCRNKDALKYANIGVRSLTMITQAMKVVDLAMKIASGAVMTLKAVVAATTIVGAFIGIGMTWVTFGLAFAAHGSMNNPVMMNALLGAIVQTVWLLVMAFIIFIPVIGQLISAIMALLDSIFYIFTWLLGDSAMGFAQAILKIFYDAQLCTDFAKDKDDNPMINYGEYSTNLEHEDLGMVDGNTMIVSSPFTGILQETAYGNADDLKLSSVTGTMSAGYDYYKPEEQAAMFAAQDKHTDPVCDIYDTVAYCTNSAALGFALTPKINGIVPVQSVTKYTIVWAAFYFGKYRYEKTHLVDGDLPDNANELKPTFMYLDVLPNNVDDLWNWSELTNTDTDGDGLTNDLEASLATSSTDWDSDDDDISDGYELEIGTNPMQADTDGDGLMDDLEIRLGTNPRVADTDGDGLTDGQEVQHYDSVTHTLVGGWQTTISGVSYEVSSDPKDADTDTDDLTDAEEKANGLSPNALNALVPSLSLEVKPLNGAIGERAGAYWLPEQNVEIKVTLANFSPYPVTSDLTLSLPNFVGNVQVGTIVGDRTPTLTISGNQLIWSFSGTKALQTYESIEIPITATTNSTSGNGQIELGLLFGDITLDKTVAVVMDNDNPDVAILAPANGAYLRGSSYVVGGAVSDPTTWITKTELSIVKQGNPANFQDLDSTAYLWAYTWNYTEDGVYTLEARATDRMGHESISAPANVTFDNTPPTATLTSTMEGSTVHLSGTATDNMAGVEFVRLSIDGQPWHSVPLDGSAWSYDWTVGESAQGEHEASMIAVDRSGNQSAVITTTINVDSVAPSSIVNSGADPDVPPAVKPNTSFKITGVADDGGHLPQPSVPANWQTGMDVFDNSTLWLGISTIHDNDGGVLAAWVGDFNADRMADLAVGLPGPDGNAGQVAVLYGRAGGWPTPPDLDMLTTSPTRFSGTAGARLGSFLAAAGDTNGDNFSDLLVGERDSSRAFLLFGNPGTLGDVTLEAGHSGYRALIQAPANIEGLASAGDVNADGYSDLLIQAGGTAYLVLGQFNPWPETIDLAAASAASFSGVTGALGVGDVDNDQLTEWVTLKSGSVTLYRWNANTKAAEVVATKSTADTAPRAVALGDVDHDNQADWLYSSGSDRILAYGSGTTRTFTGYDGFFAAPGDVDGDDRADILLTTAAGVASLVHQPENGSLTEFATIQGVGGAANAPYAAGADLNSDGSDDLLLIPTKEAAEARGFDAPDFSSGFISPQSLPLGASSVADTTPGAGELSPQIGPMGVLTAGQDTLYVDDDAVAGVCDGHSQCYTTIQAAVEATDGGGDKIIVYPGSYAAFSISALAKNNHLTIEGVSADAVFIDGGGTGNAITVGADGVHLSNLTVRNATNGVYLASSAGEPPVGSGNETTIDHLVAHSVKTPIAMNGASALSLSDSTLAGNGTDPVLSVTPSTTINSWSSNLTVPAQIGANGLLTSAGNNLYALPGGGNSTVYQATAGTDGSLGSWTQPFSLQDPLPTNTGTTPYVQGTNFLVGGASTISQLHSPFVWPNLGGLANNTVKAIAFAPNGDIYIGGAFTRIGNGEFFNLARWDGTKWNKIGTGVDPNGAVLALAFDNTGDYLYVGGEFTKVGLKDVGHVARWNLSSKTWSVLGTEGWWNYSTPPILMNGVDGPVKALAYDATHNRLYIGGSFTNATEYGSSSGLRRTYTPNLTAWSVTCTPGGETRCYQQNPNISVNGTVNTLALGGYLLYVGGTFTSVGNPDYPVAARKIAYLNTYAEAGGWSALGTGLEYEVRDIAILSQSRLAVASNSMIYEWDGSSTWSIPGGFLQGVYVVAADSFGNVYTADEFGRIKVQRGGTGAFEPMADYSYFYTTPGGWDYYVYALEVDGAGQLYAGTFGWDYWNAKNNGALSRFAPASFYQRPASGGSWSRLPYPPTASMSDQPAAVVADSSDNLYSIWGNSTNGRLYYFDAATATWNQKANPPSTMTLYHLLWAGSSLFALGQSMYPSAWHLVRYKLDTNTWTELSKPLIPDGVDAAGLSWAWDGTDCLYMLSGDGTNNFYRYHISTNSGEWLEALPVNMTYGPAAVRIGSYLYVYGPSNGTTNLYRYGSLPASDRRLAIDRTAFVVLNTAASFKWTSLSAATGSQFFLTDIDTSNAWVSPSGVSVSPGLPTGATRLTSAQAGFVAPSDGLYRLGPTSILSAGYHHYKAVAHVYPSQAACTDCTSGSLTWGVNAFATIREAVESGAARVLVHPGRYPQTFYLVSGVEVTGSGAESTIIQPPPTGTATTLVTAEGVAHASLARLTLAGGAAWSGFLAEGGAKGLKLTRTIIRDLNTGVRVRGNSQVEVVNNTLVRNVYGLVAEGTNPASVRNTIFAYNTSAGLQNSAGINNTYNDFWSNTKDIDPSPSSVSLGSLFVDPRFRSLQDDDLRLAANSPLIDKGAPGDPTAPGSGKRVDIGYAEYNAAGFYVSPDYSETGLDDGLTWGVDAFAQIQPALNAASAAMRDLQGALPEGGYTVGVDAGTYTENVTVPSHVRLVGSGAAVTTISADAVASGSVVTFDGVIDSELSGFTVQNAGSGAAGVELKGAASGITIARNVIRTNTSYGIKLSAQSSAEVLFNTIINNTSAGVYASGANTWAVVRSNILDGNAIGLQAVSGALLHNDYNLLHNMTNLSGVTAGDGTLTSAPAFAASGYYVPSATSPAIDAADPLAAVPPAGGLRADLGYKELIASPLTLLFGPQVKTTISRGNSGLAKVEVGVVAVSDASQPVTDTLPATWQTITPSQSGQQLFYWSQNTSQANPGFYRVYSRATDAAGNTESDENDWYEGAFVVDNTALSVSLVLNPSGTTTASATLATATVSGTVSTGSGTRPDVKQVYFSVTGPAGSASYPAQGGQAWIPLPVAGTYTVTAIAVDEAGNQAQQSQVVTVVSGSSVATVTSPQNGTAVAKTSVTLLGDVRFTGAGNGQVNLSVTGGGTVSATLDSPGSAFSAWSAQVTLPAGEGAKTITVTPSLNGTPGLGTTLNLILDTTPPVLVVTSPAVGASVQQTVTFSGTASDAGSGLSRVEVSVDGGSIWRQAALNAGAWSLAWDLGLDQDYVSYPVQVRAVDKAGNAALIKRPVAVDSLPPTGLQPVTFSHAEGDHLEDGTELVINWNTPTDASGSVQVFIDVNMLPPVVNDVETMPTTIRTGTSAAQILGTVGEWYVHIMAQDAAGNQTLYHYGPWYVEDMSDNQISNRHKSVVIDGFIDKGLHEWKQNDLLGEDARSGHPEKLYAAWDAQYVYLGWTSAWWTLDGVLWAYLDTVDGSGANTQQDGAALPPNLLADQAVEITAPDDGSLWSWNGTAWVEGNLDFANGPSGDTEVRVPWTPSSSQQLKLVAYALPREAEDVQSTQMLASAGMEITPQETPDIDPSVVFPTTNALDQLAINNFAWSPADLVSQNPNQNQPTARTVYMTVSSPQASGAAWGSTNELDYDIMLTNPELTAISNLTISLTATSGLTYLSQSGATCTSCTNGSDWTLTVAALAAGETKTITVNSRTGSDLSGIQAVTSTFSLSAGTTAFTPESQLDAAVTHRVDGQAPTVTIHALGGSAIPAVTATFTGAASDGAADGGPGSGVAYVEVSLNGGAWTRAEGTQAWSITLPVTGSSVTLQARAKDYAGITGSTTSHTFYIDSTPPTVTWTLPAVTTARLARISGTVLDQGPAGSRVGSVEVQLDEAGLWCAATLVTSPSGTQSWIWTWATPQEDGVSHTVRVRATDEVGNATTTASQTTTLETAGPKITITQQPPPFVYLPNDPGAVIPSSNLDLDGALHFYLPLVTQQSSASQPSSTNTTESGVSSATIIQPTSTESVTLLAGTVTETDVLIYFHVVVYGPNGFTTTASITPDKDGAWTYISDLTGWQYGTYKLRVEAKDLYGYYSLVGPFSLVAKDSMITGLAATNDSPHKINEVVNFTATVASGSNVVYDWTFGDGSSGSGRTTTHVYANGGTFTAQVKAHNSANTLYANTTVSIGAPVQTGPLFTVNSTAPTSDHRCDEANCTLREAIEAANNDGLDSTIELSKLDYGLSEVDNHDSDNTSNLLPQIITNITINGHGARIYRTGAIPFGRFFSVPGATARLTLNEVWLRSGKVDRTLLQPGGAISNYGILTVKNSLLDTNEGSKGGAIYNERTLYLYNSTLYNNITDYGAIAGSGSFFLYSNTLLNNQGSNISGIYLSYHDWSEWGFYNNLLVRSPTAWPLCNLRGLNIPMAGNLATDSSCTGFGTTTTTALSLTRGLPYDEGGPTPSVAISSTSFAVDRGNTAACQLAALEIRDQRGYKRFADGNNDGIATCDVGAFEYGSTLKPPAPAPDDTPPLVRILLAPTSPDGANGWYRSPVSVDPQARDIGSGVIEMRCALDPEVVPASFDELPEDICPFLGGAPVDADGSHSFYIAAMDLNGNKSGVASTGFQIDGTPPVITCPAGGPFLLNSGEQAIGPAGVDASVSGLDEAASTLSGVISTDSVGLKLLTFTAYDLAGNSASQECGYAVIYDFGGFYSPFEPAPALNPVNAGGATPLKFSLAGDQGLDVIANGSPTSQQIDCQTLVPAGDPVPTRSVGKSGLSYDPLTGWYNFIWRTEKRWAGTCQALSLQLVDGTQHPAYFIFK